MCVCVCVCIVHNGCVYIGFGVHVFIHACTFICTCRLCFLSSREPSAWRLSVGDPDTYWFDKVVAGRLMQSIHLECVTGFVGSLVLLRVNVYPPLPTVLLVPFHLIVFVSPAPVSIRSVSRQTLTCPIFHCVFCAVSFLHVQGAGDAAGCHSLQRELAKGTPWP